MGEKVVESVPGGGVAAQDFKSEQVKVCPSCDTVNPATADRCAGCGEHFEASKIDTVAGTCPNCNNDRPFVPEQQPQTIGQNPDGSLITRPGSPQQYYGDCPHCHQDATDANAALDKLQHGDNSAWGKGAARPRDD